MLLPSKALENGVFLSDPRGIAFLSKGIKYHAECHKKVQPV
jgi:hypothetical protein